MDVLIKYFVLDLFLVLHRDPDLAGVVRVLHVSSGVEFQFHTLTVLIGLLS